MEPTHTEARAAVHAVARAAAHAVDRPAVLLLVTYVTAAGALLFNAQPALVGVFAEHYGFSETELGRLMSIALVAAFGVVVSAFFWVRRASWRRATRLGAAVACAGAASLLLFDRFAGVATALALLGAGMAIMYAPAVAALAGSRDPARAFGLAICLQVAVASLTVFMLPAVLLPDFGLPGVVGYLVVVMLPALACAGLMPPGSGSKTGSESAAAPTTEANRSPGRLAMLGLGAMLVYFAGLNGTWAFLERIGIQTGLSPDAVGAGLATSLLVGALGALAASLLGRRVSIPWALTIAAAGFVVFLLLVAGQPGAIRFALALVVFNAAWNFSLPYQMDAIARVDAEHRYIVLVPAAQTIGGAAGPALAGAMMARAGLVGVYGQLVVGVVAAFLLYGLLAARSERSARRGAEPAERGI